MCTLYYWKSKVRQRWISADPRCVLSPRRLSSPPPLCRQFCNYPHSSQERISGKLAISTKVSSFGRNWKLEFCVYNVVSKFWANCFWWMWPAKILHILIHQSACVNHLPYALFCSETSETQVSICVFLLRLLFVTGSSSYVGYCSWLGLHRPPMYKHYKDEGPILCLGYASMSVPHCLGEFLLDALRSFFFATALRC